MQRSSVAAHLRAHGRVVDRTPKPLVSLSAGYRWHKQLLARRAKQEAPLAHRERLRVDPAYRDEDLAARARKSPYGFSAATLIRLGIPVPVEMAGSS